MGTMRYQITIPYDIHAERRGETDPEKIESHERWFVSDTDFYKGDKLEWGDRLLEVAGRRPVVSFPDKNTEASGHPYLSTRPRYEAVNYIKLFCENA